MMAALANVLTSWPNFASRLKTIDVQQFYSRSGYIRANEFLSADEIHVINEELDRYLEDMDSLPAEHVFYEDKSRPRDTLVRLECMHMNGEFFKALAQSSVLNGLADILLGIECEVNNVQYFSKPPGCQGTPPHQDGRYFMHDRGITFWLALVDVDEEIGCMYYVPGTHTLRELDHHRTNQIGFSQELTEYPATMKTSEEKQEVSAGTLLGHHPYTVHRAGPNKSSARWRSALGFTYWTKECRDDKKLHERRRKYKEQLMQELKQTGKI